ncbi:MAG: transglutaminase family protein, partial [Firmicutes bacterium]|nr:transglutaminase family protein [Bacillota bacterium]
WFVDMPLEEGVEIAHRGEQFKDALQEPLQEDAIIQQEGVVFLDVPEESVALPNIGQRVQPAGPPEREARDEKGEKKNKKDPGKEKWPEEREPVKQEEFVYVWGAPCCYDFCIEVQVACAGDCVARNVRATVPLLENDSLYYQQNVLKGASHDYTTSGNMATFNLGDIAPGEVETILVTYGVTIRPVKVLSAGEVVNTAKRVFDQLAGSGNCRDLALKFVNRCNELGVLARLVNGYIRSKRGNMTPGYLDGCRHSWAEFYEPSLGWVPVDLTFKYFAHFPYASHVIEGYDDRSIRVDYLGGAVDVTWRNSVMAPH